MNNDIKKLIDLADKWKELSQKINGWDTKEYHSDKLCVRCYFDIHVDQTSVSFTFKGQFRDFEVSYFTSRYISYHETIDFKKTYQEAFDLYQDVKNRFDNQSKQ